MYRRSIGCWRSLRSRRSGNGWECCESWHGTLENGPTPRLILWDMCGASSLPRGKARCGEVGVILQHHPDHVFGADAVFISNARLPLRRSPEGYLETIPELVVEVRSPGDRWRDIQKKITEYLQAGVLTVVVLDPGLNTAHVFSADDPPRTLGADDELILTGILEGFRVRVGRFFA